LREGLGANEEIFFGGKENFLARAPERFAIDAVFPGIRLESSDAGYICFGMAEKEP